MVVEAGEVLQPFRASKKRPTPTATLPRQSGPAPGTEPQCGRVPCNHSASLPGVASLDGDSGLAPHGLLSPAVLTSNPRSPEALGGRHLINHCSNGSGSSSLAVQGHVHVILQPLTHGRAQ